MNTTSLSVRASRGLLAASGATLLTAALAVAIVPQTLRGMLSMPFLPHAYCYLYDRRLIAFHLGSDAAIWLSYVAISVTLGYLVYRTRREIPFSWMLLAFGTFIIACGFTHFMEMVVLWKPVYWLSADVKLITAVASVITAITFPPLVPKVHDLVLAAKRSNDRESQLENANRELFRANETLKKEIAGRTRAEEELRTLTGRLLQLQDDERRRLARELHDSTGQLLTGIQLNLSFVDKELAGRDGNLRRWLEQTVQLTDAAIGEIRTMSYLLHPPMLDESGLILALQWYVEGFMQRSHVQVNLQLPSDLDRLTPDAEVAIFRIVQESLTNIHRHSCSKQADISLLADAEELILSIRDYGKGIPGGHYDLLDRRENKVGVGLRGMAERVRQLGGHLSIAPANPGTLVEARLPLSASHNNANELAQASGGE